MKNVFKGYQQLPPSSFSPPPHSHHHLFDQKALDFSVEVAVLYCVAYPTLHLLLCLIRDYTERTKALTNYFMFIRRSGFLIRKITYHISHSRPQTVTFLLGMSN